MGSSYRYNVNSFTGKMKSLYWDGPNFPGYHNAAKGISKQILFLKIEWFDKSMCIKSP